MCLAAPAEPSADYPGPQWLPAVGDYDDLIVCRPAAPRVPPAKPQMGAAPGKVREHSLSTLAWGGRQGLPPDLTEESRPGPSRGTLLKLSPWRPTP